MKFKIILFLIFPYLSIFSQKIAFVNVNVIPFTEADLILKNHTVLVNGDRIIEIGELDKVQVPKTYDRIEGNGEKYLIPGLMDNHAHLPITQGLDMSMDDYLFLNLANGVTSLRCCRYEESAMALRDSLVANNILAPRLFLSSPMVANSKTPEYTFDYTQADVKIKEFKEQGYDFVKMLSGVNPYTHKGIMDICHQESFPVVGHLPRSVSLEYAIVAKQDDIEHFQGYVQLLEKDEKLLDSLILETVKKDIYNCPTIYWYDSNYPFLKKEYLSQIDGLEYIDPEMKKSWFEDLDKYTKENAKNENSLRENKRKDVLKKFAAVDAKLLLSHGDGAFCIPGFGLLEEAKIWKEAGISNYRILESMSKNSALFFNQEKEWGVLTKNSLADLVLLNKNPIEHIINLRSIAGVMAKGKWINEKAIKQGLEKIKATHN